MPELQGFPALFQVQNPNVPIPGYLFSMKMEGMAVMPALTSMQTMVMGMSLGYVLKISENTQPMAVLGFLSCLLIILPPPSSAGIHRPHDRSHCS